MILVTRLNGPVFALNPDLVERADCTPDTVVTLVDGTKYVIAESVPEFMQLVQTHRAAVIAAARHMDPATLSGRPPRREHPGYGDHPSGGEDPHRAGGHPTHDDLDRPGPGRRHEPVDGTAKVFPLHRKER